jgi:hypothetical protein
MSDKDCCDKGCCGKGCGNKVAATRLLRQIREKSNAAQIPEGLPAVPGPSIRANRTMDGQTPEVDFAAPYLIKPIV